MLSTCYLEKLPINSVGRGLDMGIMATIALTFNHIIKIFVGGKGKNNFVTHIRGNQEKFLCSAGILFF
jgi:hypothetical protein